MKTIYKCDVCGKEFTDGWEQCREHEKTCEEIHATGLRLTKELNSAVAAANERGGVKIAHTYDGEKAWKIDGVYYDARAKAVVLKVSEDRGFETENKEDADNE